MNFLLALLASGLCLMPPYPEDSTRGAAKVAPVVPVVVPEGLDAPAPFDMAGHLNRQGMAKVSPTGEPTGFNVLVVLVGFDAIYPDTDKRVLPRLIDSLVFSAEGRTVRDYYWDQSAGRINLTTLDLPSQLGWRVAPRSKASYVNNQYGFGAYPNNSQGMCEDILAQIDPFIDFSRYDNDGDGWVDGLILAQSGTGAEYSGATTDFWSHKWQIRTQTRDGVKVGPYAVVPTFWRRLGDMTIGVYAHEIGHLFGLADYYDVDGSSQGTGRWALMSGGSWNGALGNRPAPLCGFDKVKLGFVDPVPVNSSGYVNLGFGDVLRLFADPQIPSRLIFATYHHATYGSYYDGGLPYSGVLIEMVDEAKPGNTQEWYPGIDPARHYRIAIVQADSLWNLERNQNSGDSRDPFPWFRGGASTNYLRDFTPKWYDGKELPVKISGITLTGDLRSAFMKVETCSCPSQGDIDGDGDVDWNDVWALVGIVYYGAADVQDAGCPASRGDIDASGFVDSTDLQFLIDAVQSGGAIIDPCKSL